jgi:hypothetical protein
MVQSVDEQFRRVFDSLLERVQTEIRTHSSQGLEQLDLAIEGFATREAELVALVEQARSEGYQSGLQAGRTEEAGQQQARTAETVAGAVADGIQSALSRALAAVRSLDEATALSQTLETLVAAIRAHSRHAGLFLLRNGRLRSWGAAEFSTSDGQPVTDLNPDEAGVIADAVRTGTPHLATSADRWPSFVDQSSAGVFAAVPLIMNGQVIAVLCADHGSSIEGTQLALTCELLARHAAQHLESLTARRLAQTGAPQSAAAS